jgi:N-carbamoylputrescine amidase
MEDVRIAAAQITSVVGQVADNLAKHEEYVRRAAAAGARVICFPELSLSGYPTGSTVPLDLAQPLSGELAQEIRALSRAIGVVVLAGMLELDRSGVVYNTQLVAGPEGLLGAYRKVHVPTSEIRRFSHGSAFPVFRLPWATIGVQICYDSHYPEGSTIQALQGAEVIFLPHASTGGDRSEPYEAKRARWLRYMPARAYDNRLYLVVVNQVGFNGEVEFPGIAFALDPDGVVIGEARPDVEDLLIVDLSGERLTKARTVAEGYFAHFRRPELYGPIARLSQPTMDG